MSYDLVPSAEQQPLPPGAETASALEGLRTLQRETTPLPDINELEPFSDTHLEHLHKIAAFMEQEGIPLTEWTLTRGHEHFPVADNEILLETNDPTERTLLSRVVKRSETDPQTAMPTTFRLDDLPKDMGDLRTLRGCQSICVQSPISGSHIPGHRGTE